MFLLLVFSCILSLVAGAPRLAAVPNILVEGNSGVITCTDPIDTVVSVSKNGLSIPDCITNSKCKYTLMEQTAHKLSVNIRNVSRIRDGGTWKCAGTGFNIAVDVRVVAKRELLLGAEGRQNAIFGLDVLTREIQKLPITLKTGPVALSYDPTTDKVYWSDNTNHLIRTADLKGNMAETVTGSTGTSVVDGMAVDYINRLLYYTDTGPDTINVLSLDNYDYRLTLIDTGLDEPRAIVTLPNDGMMFWTDWGVESKIEMADMDGSNRHLFLSLPNGTWPNGLAIDAKAKMVYWADAKLHRIESISMDKSSRTVIYQSTTAHYFSIVLMGNHIYYNDWTESYISRMTKAGDLLEQFGPAVLQRSFGMYAYNYSEITQGSSVCENSNCQQLCLPKQFGQHTCGCKNGYILSSDKISCQIDNSKIITKPLTIPHNVTEGRQLEIRCEFNTTSSIPSSGYTWRKSGIMIPGQSSSIYRLQSVQRSDDGNYTCAVDISGTTMITTIILNILYPPNVTVPPEMKVIESTTLSITCTAEANPSIINFKWTGPNGQDLTKYDFEATKHTTLTMPYVDRTRSGEYSCTASNTMIESSASTHPITARSSKITTVHILYGPSTETSQETFDVTMLSNLKLTCSVDSNPEPSSYQWYHPDGSSAAVTKYLDLSNIRKNQAGEYKCETITKLAPTNGDPITKPHSKIFTVNVLYAPTEESSNEVVNVTVNSNVMLNCSVDSNPQPSSYKWFSPGGTVKSSTRELPISNIKETEGGDYRCEAVIVLVPTEGEPITKVYAHITSVNILYVPEEDSSNEVVNVTVNSNVMLNCSVDSNPQPSSYKWFSPGGTVKSSTRELLISNIKETEGGDYRCEAVIVLVPTEGEPITKDYTHITSVNILSSLGNGEQPKINTINMKTVGLGVGISAAIIVIMVVVVIAAVCYKKHHVRGQNRELNRFHNASDARPFAGMEVSTIAGQSSENPYAVLYDNRQDGNTTCETSVTDTPTNVSEVEHPYDTVSWKAPWVNCQVESTS